MLGLQGALVEAPAYFWCLLYILSKILNFLFFFPTDMVVRVWEKSHVYLKDRDV